MNSNAEDDPRYQRALRRLIARERFGIRLGLSRTRALLRRLGEPQRGLPGVLIGGTNGKGSVQAMVAAALSEAGHRTGQTPKPHLVSYRERMVVAGEPIPPAEFAQLIEEVLDAAAGIERRHGSATEFEVLTAAAFCWFRRAGVELAVVEVGMGGRLDATNVWQGGLSAITNVALDHTERLGETVELIAAEKAQIIKRGDALALTAAHPPALPVIERRARRVGVPLRRVEALPVIAVEPGGTVLAAPDGSELKVGLLGRHQAHNAALAMAILEAMEQAGMASVPVASLRRALAEVRWPGRLELLERAVGGGQLEVLLDGAHNPHGSAALAAAFDELRPHLSPGRATLLLAIMSDKDVAGVLEPLLRSASLREAQLVATSVPDTTRSLAAEELAAAWLEGARRLAWRAEKARVMEDTAAALEKAIQLALRQGGPLLVCGSLYLVGYVRGRLVAGDRAPTVANGAD